MTWIVEWSNLSNYEFGITDWVFEDDALKYACNELVSHIENLDSEDEELIDTAKIINAFLKAKQYREAINHWNDCSYNVDNCESIYWSVRLVTPQRFYSKVDILNLDKYLAENTNDDETITTISIVNDHTCILCKNDKCSKQEATCWKCGHPIS